MKIICITGDTGGIGKLLVKQLLKFKDIKVFGCSRSKSKFQDKNYNHKILDTTISKKVKTWFESIYKLEKNIDCLICLSGSTVGGGLVYNFLDDDFNTNILSTLSSTFVCNREILKYFVKNKSGSIINISSISEKKNLIGSSIYSASKSAISKFTKILAKENIQYNINANIILPMYIKNIDTKKRGKEWEKKILSMQDKKNEGDITTLCNLIMFLSNKENNLITGQEISIGTVV